MTTFFDMEQTYEILEYGKTRYVLTQSQDRGGKLGASIGKANFHNTGLALCGVLKKGETLKKFIQRKNGMK